MAKRIEKDGRSYRMRRGKLVEIPTKWIGQTLTPQTKRKRLSKLTHKDRVSFDPIKGHPNTRAPRHTEGSQQCREGFVGSGRCHGVLPCNESTWQEGA